MKSQLHLQAELTRDVFSWFGFDPGKDLSTLERRFAHEGDAFLEESLPVLNSHLLEGIETGFFRPVQGWKKSGSAPYPQFLSELWSRVFSDRGELHDSPDVNAVRGIRQISLFSKKIFEVCSDDRVSKAIDAFVRADNELKFVEAPSVNVLSDIFDTVFSKTITRTLRDFNRDRALKHGPGAVAEKYRDRVSKYTFASVPDSLLDKFGYDTFRPFWTDPRKIEDVSVLARLVAVPKDRTKPRLICIEPSYNQYIQQGLQSYLQEHLASTPCGYKDQTINQELAKTGSIGGYWSTIDLSEASDRVHDSVLKLMLDNKPIFWNLIQSIRSSTIQLPDRRKLSLTKFASMGNALTFPIEGMYFTVLSLYGMCVEDGDFSKSNVVRHAKEDLRVYGDDIIVPRMYFEAVTHGLERFGLKVNRSKSFSGIYRRNYFRESCGGDFMNGVNITPIYRRSQIPRSRRQVEEIISSISTQNHLFNSQIFPRTSQAYAEILHGLGVPTLPYTSTTKLESSRKKGWSTDLVEPWSLGQCEHCEEKIRRDGPLQRFVIKTFIPHEQLHGDPIDGWERLQSSLDRNLVPNKDGVVDRSPDGRVGRIKLKPTRVEVSVN